MSKTIQSAILAVLSLCGVALAAAPSLWVETSGTMILSNRAPGTAKEIVLTGVRNECVSVQLALRSSQEAAKPWEFEWTSLKRTGGGEIAKGSIELFRAADIMVTHGSKDNRCKDPLRDRPLGLFPDALVPLYTHEGVNVANAIQPPKDSTLAFWVDITVPTGIPAGLYSGAITLKADGSDIVVPVKLTVADVEIPAETTIPSMYNLRNERKHVGKYLDTYVKDIMAHRIQPSNYHYRDQDPSLMDRLNPGGKGFVSVMFGGSADASQSTADSLKKVTAHLKERGLFDRAFLQLKDEPRSDDIPHALEIGKFVLQTAPEWKGKIAETLSMDEGGELFQLVDHHVYPLARYGSSTGSAFTYAGKKMYERADWDKVRAQGKKLWFYMSNNQGTPFPTFDVNTPEVAFEARVVMWMWWFEKGYGHLYWDLVGGNGFALSSSFPPGDGQLLYEGDLSVQNAPAWALVKDIKEPVMSRRLKLMRNGIGEWEMLKMAEKKVGYEKISAIVAKVYDHMGGKYDPGKPMWSYKESDWDNARAELIKLLEAK